MALIACPVKGKKKSADICAAFIAGAPDWAQGRVFYGVDASNAQEWRHAQKASAPWYYIDNSYFDSMRGQQYRVARSALQIDAMAHWSDGKRFDALGLAIKPLQHNPDGHTVIIEQSPSFMQFVGAPHWLDDITVWAAMSSGGTRLRRWSADKLAIQKTLLDDLKGAHRLMTHSSAAAITALLEGIPVIVERTSAVARVRLSTDNSVDDRRQAFSVLADHQWTLNEMKEGKAWAKLGL
jgi:hypothetical protein